MPGRLHRRPEPGMRGRGQALVYIYSRAPAGIIGVLQSVQKRPEFGGDCQRSNTPQLVGSEIADATEYAQPKTSHPEPRTCCAGSSFGVGASIGDSGAECRDRAVGGI